MELAVLRTAKAALAEGLIQEGDFQAVKGAFVKAQSIRAGLDAGFISENDFAVARQEFFRSLGMMTMPGAPGTPAMSTPMQAFPSMARGANVGGSADSAAFPAVPLGSDYGSGAKLEALPSTIARNVPTDIPDYGGAKKTEGKASMSGIAIHPDAVNIVGEMRIRKKYRWIVFKIGQTGKQVEAAYCGGPEATFEEFASYMPEKECRYGVFDYEYVNSEGTIYGKLVFVSWAPEVAATKAKMQHASTKDFFRGFLDGISVELHATEPGEIDEEALRERVANTVAKK